MMIKKICKICGEECFLLKKHLKEKHNLTEEGYYNAQRKYECMIKNGVKILLSSDLIELGIIL